MNSRGLRLILLRLTLILGMSICLSSCVELQSVTGTDNQGKTTEVTTDTTINPTPTPTPAGR